MQRWKEKKIPNWGPQSVGRDDPRDPGAPVYPEEEGFNRDRVSIAEALASFDGDLDVPLYDFGDDDGRE
jgi:hypothetical protein